MVDPIWFCGVLAFSEICGFPHDQGVGRTVLAAKAAADARFGVLEPGVRVHAFFAGQIRHGQAADRTGIDTDPASRTGFDDEDGF